MGAMGQSVFTVGRGTTGVWVGRGGNGCDGYRDCDCPAWPNSIYLDLTVLFVPFVSIFGVWSLEVRLCLLCPGSKTPTFTPLP